MAATYLLLYASSICTLSTPLPAFSHINFTHFAQFSPFTMFSVFILINLSDSWMSYSASLLQILFIFMFVFICLFSSPSPLSLLFQLLLSAIPTGAAPKNWRHVIDAFLMRILGHELNAIYCGNGKREREGERAREEQAKCSTFRQRI